MLRVVRVEALLPVLITRYFESPVSTRRFSIQISVITGITGEIVLWFRKYWDDLG